MLDKNQYKKMARMDIEDTNLDMALLTGAFVFCGIIGPEYCVALLFGYTCYEVMIEW